jgi:hypothetical protein
MGPDKALKVLTNTQMNEHQRNKVMNATSLASKYKTMTGDQVAQAAISRAKIKSPECLTELKKMTLPARNYKSQWTSENLTKRMAQSEYFSEHPEFIKPLIDAFLRMRVEIGGADTTPPIPAGSFSEPD